MIPYITYTATGNKASNNKCVSITFKADIDTYHIQIRSTPLGADWGVGKGTLLLSLDTYTPANTERTLDVYASDVSNIDGDYRISLFASVDGVYWNDDTGFLTQDLEPVITSDGKNYLVQKEVV